jgi:hypothetical protein
MAIQQDNGPHQELRKYAKLMNHSITREKERIKEDTTTEPTLNHDI